jgi:hypothetical protein
VIKKPLDKTRVVVWLLAILIILVFAFFGPSSIVQNKNMNKVLNFSEILTSNEAFKDVKVMGTTANLGRQVFIVGTVKKQDDLTKLKNLVKENLPPKFHVVYSVELEDSSNTPVLPNN